MVMLNIVPSDKYGGMVSASATFTHLAINLMLGCGNYSAKGLTANTNICGSKP